MNWHIVAVHQRPTQRKNPVVVSMVSYIPEDDTYYAVLSWPGGEATVEVPERVALAIRDTFLPDRVAGNDGWADSIRDTAL